MSVIRRRLIKQAVAASKLMLTELPLKFADARFILTQVFGGGKQFEPNRLESETAQSQHPLQRYRKIAASFGIFRGKAAAEKDRHRQRIVRLGFRSSLCRPSFDGPSIIR